MDNGIDGLYRYTISQQKKLAKLLGFELLSNMVICLFIAILMFLTLILTVIIAGQKKKTTLLIQELSLLKSEVKKND